MAESSRFWATNNTGDGLSSGFTVTHWQNFVSKLFEGGEMVNGAVLRGVDNQLACSGTASPITVATGAAIGYGHFYENDTSLTLAVTTPTVNTTGGHIVLETNWTAQTVRAKMYKNTDGLSAIPALTQNAGTLWQTRLCSFTITTGGVITITDARAFAHYSTEIVASMIKDGVITTAKIADGAVTTIKIADANVTTGKIADSNVTTIKIADNNVTTTKIADANVIASKIADGNITTAKLANDSVDDTKAGDRVPQFIRRQGGNASFWSTPGTTNYIPTSVRMQAGMVQFNTTATSGGVTSFAVTFPIAFSASPVFFVSRAQFGAQHMHVAGLANATTGTIYVENQGLANDNIAIFWLAIGPE